MSSSENQPDNLTEGLQIPGLVQNAGVVEQLSFTASPPTPFFGLEPGAEAVEQLSFAENPLTPVPAFPPFAQAENPTSSAGLSNFNQARGPLSQVGLAPQRVLVHPATQALLRNSQAGITQELMNSPRPDPHTTASRQPMVIRGKERPVSPLSLPPHRRRRRVNLAIMFLLLVFTVGALFVVSPLGHDVAATLRVQAGNVIQGTPQGKIDLVAQATATAIIHQQNDGIDPGSNGGGATLGTGSGSLSWPYGYCTYWANLRYHELTGVWVAWHGNADQWVAGARLANWNVSQTPHVPSIIVLMDGVQGASYVGHVAVVESATGNVAHTTNMNWYTNGGGFGIVSKYDFTAGAGVYFIWK